MSILHENPVVVWADDGVSGAQLADLPDMSEAMSCVLYIRLSSRSTSGGDNSTSVGVYELDDLGNLVFLAGNASFANSSSPAPLYSSRIQVPTLYLPSYKLRVSVGGTNTADFEVSCARTFDRRDSPSSFTGSFEGSIVA